MTPRNELELVELRALAIYEAEDEWDGMQNPGSATSGPWDKLPDRWRNQYRHQARATIEAEKQARLAIVPLEATEAKRSLLKKHGYDPDALADGSVLETLDLVSIAEIFKEIEVAIRAGNLIGGKK